MIRAVVFDLDDTLFPEDQFVMSGFRAVENWLSATMSVTGFFIIAERLFREGQRANMFDRALDLLGIKSTPALIGTMLQVYRQHRPQIELCDDARWAIEFFGRFHRLGILTDGYLVPQRNKVEALGIASYFSTIVYSDEHGHENWKPSPLPFQKVMDFLACRGEECVYIADNPAKDFVTARKLGWQTIRICRESGEYSHLIAEPGYDADTSITSLFQLSDLIPGT